MHAAAVRLGCTIAIVVLEMKGTAAYRLDGATMLERIVGAYGKDAGAQLAPHFASVGLGRPMEPAMLVAEP